jgi:diguanylate cyclase (GGDEF) domain
MTQNGQTESKTIDTTLNKELFDMIAVPVVIGRACYNDMGTIDDIKIVYVNKEHKHETKEFLKAGDGYQSLAHSLPAGINWFNECVKTLKTGTEYQNEYFSARINTWFHLVIQKYMNDYLIFTISNITSEKIKESHLEFLETNDTNTGLANSKKFNEMLQQAVQDAEQNKKLLGLILMDIDNLRSLNDLSGRAVGDEVINTCANILMRMESQDIHAFRIEGDEFALLVTNVATEQKLRTLSEDLFVRLSTRNVSLSMGIAIYPNHDTTSLTLFRDADLALHSVKNNGKGNFAFYEADMYNDFLKRIKIQKMIFIGIQKNQFQLFYQPQFYLGEHNLRGFEALIRWHDGPNGWYAPLSFIPIAEESNVIQILGEWILETAIATLKKWQKNYSFTGIMSINVSPVQLKSPLFVANLERIIKQNDVNPQKIELEITESVFISNIEETANLLKKIQSFGVRISLDDFGTGYSSLRYLSSMPINTLKLDKSFIDSINDKNTINSDLISSLIPVTKKAGMETIAEGVEQPAQLVALKDMNCNCIQGFLWGKPMPAEKCEKFLAGDSAILDRLEQ